MHGVKYLAIGALWRRLVWSLLIFAAVGGFLALAIGSIIQFTQRNTSTKFSVHYPESIPFPVVTICNRNTFMKSKVLNLTNGKAILDELEKFDLHTLDGNHSSDFDVLEDAGGFEYLVMKTGVEFHNLIVYDNESKEYVYTFGTHHTMADFDLTLTPFGKCYSFNKNQMHSVYGSGISSGFTVLLNIQQDEYVSPGFLETAGLQVLVHLPHETPQTVLSSGFSVYPGTHTSVQIRESRVKNLQNPYGQCDKSKPANYSRNNCDNRCYYEALKEKCKCREIYMTGLRLLELADFPILLFFFLQNPIN